MALFDIITRQVTREFTRDLRKMYFKSTRESICEDSCVVCLDNITDFVTLECTHSFCFACILGLSKYNCPICRKLITSIQYHGKCIKRQELTYFAISLGYVLPSKNLASSLAAVRYSREFPAIKQCLHGLIEKFFDEMCNFEIIN
jgi:Zinc finger, C3HC4 type (RING finger)